MDSVDSLPTFESSLLGDFSRAIERRRKSLKYGTESFSLTRELESHDEDSFERLNFELVKTDQCQILFSLWSDEVMWLRLCKATKNGWAFNLAFHGTVREVSEDKIVEMLKKTKNLFFIPENREKFIALWSAVKPEIDI